TSSSTKLARPFQILRTTVVPSYSTHSLDPLNGCFNLHRCVCQFPNSQSKSCCPLRADADEAGSDVAEVSCASTTTALTSNHNPKNLRIIDEIITDWLSPREALKR